MNPHVAINQPEKSLITVEITTLCLTFLLSKNKYSKLKTYWNRNVLFSILAKMSILISEMNL